ncbi:MAG: ATP-binding protein [Pseudomonadota bacterium]
MSIVTPQTDDLLADLAPVALLALDSRRRIRAANTEAETQLGLSRRSLSGKALSEIIYHDTPLFELIDKAESMAGSMYAHGVPISGPTLAEGLLNNVRIKQDDAGGFILAFAPTHVREGGDHAPGVAAFGRILGHEVKNPLAGISGAAQLLQRDARPEQEELLSIVVSETQRIERLISRLSAFELFSAPRLKPVNIHDTLDRVLKAEEAAFADKVVYRRMYDPSLPPVLGDEDHLHEAFQNLVRNASEASTAAGGTGQVTVRTAYEAGLRIVPKTSPRKRLSAMKVVIQDDGPGIPPDRQAALFEMFQSTKSGGRGLGLSVVGEIVSAHGGQVKVESRPGKTRFSIFLPLAGT